MDPIEPELLFAVTPFSDWLRPGRVKVTMADRAEATRTPKKIAALIDAFLDDPPGAAADFKAIDWPKTRDLLAADPDPAEMAQKLEGLEPDLAIAMTEAATRSWAFLRGIMPARQRMTSLGPATADPGHSEILRFSRSWIVVETPMTVLTDLCAGCLTRRQSEAFDACFPALSEFVRKAMFEAVAERKGDKDGFRLARWREHMLEALLRVGATPSALAASYQKEFAGDETGQSSQPMPDLSKLAPDTASKGQRLAAG